MSSASEEPKKKRKKPDLPIVPIKSTADYQRMKLERLMANPEKPVMIPSKPKERNLPPPPDFVRNIMGSSAGAGSGEFHVYRHLRRKEYARQKTLQEQAKRDELELEFKKKVEERQKIADDKAAKRKAKSLKKKAARQRNRGKKMTKKESSSSSSSAESDHDDKEKEQSGSTDVPAQSIMISTDDKVLASDSATATNTTSNPESVHEMSEVESWPVPSKPEQLLPLNPAPVSTEKTTETTRTG